MSAKVWEDRLVLKTYLRGPDDPLPHWERTGLRRVYPYPMQDDLTDIAQDVSYRALHLENEYLHAIVLPELGGRLYSLYDKVTKREVFYRNNVVKPGLVARRGAWISGGIEFNFPQGHTCVTVSPVAAAITTDEETGAASIHVGTTDRVSRMRWTVKLTLSPAQARLRQDVMLQNLLPWRQRYYFWANAAVPARDDLRLVYPATKCRTLGGDRPYPIQDGRDMSWYRNHEQPNDIFALDVTEDFFGCYYEATDVGLVHWSPHGQNLGKKFFTWGTADDGMIWVDLLTDDDGQYVELQSGRFVDQSTFEFLRPYQSVRWTEFWYPVHGMGGFCWANDIGALNLKLRARAVSVAALVSVPVGFADFVLDVDGEEVWREEHFFEPGEAITDEVAMRLPKGRDCVVGLSVENECGVIMRCEHPPAYLRGDRAEFSLLNALSGPSEAYDEWQEAISDLDVEALGVTVPAPLPTEVIRLPEDPGITAEELCRHAVRAEKVDELERAREFYQKAIQKEPGFSAARLGLGVIALKLDDPEEAREHLRQCLARNADCDEAWYYLGWAYWLTGGFATAQEIWARLAADSTCRTEAAIAVSRCTEYGAAMLYLRALLDNPLSAFLMALRSRIESLEIPEMFAVVAKEYPLAPEVAAEEYLWAEEEYDDETSERAWTRLREMLLNDPDLWLELCFFYQQMDAMEDGWALLLRAAQEIPNVRRSPMVSYVLRFAAAQGLEMDDELPDMETVPEYCFPARPEEIGYLDVACRADPHDWQARLYLGEIYANLGRREQALESWQAAARIDDTDAVLCRNLALAYHLWQGDTDAALGWYAKAINSRAEEYRLYLERDDVLRVSGAGPATRLDALETAPPKLREHWALAARRAECLVELGRWNEALAELETHTFRPWEGSRQMHTLWTRALCGRAAQREQEGDYAGALADYELALTYPRNLGVGRAAHPEEAKVRWLAAECARKLRDAEKQRKLLEEAASEQHTHPCEADLYSLKALQALGRQKEAKQVAQNLLKWARERLTTHPNDPLARQIEEVVA